MGEENLNDFERTARHLKWVKWELIHKQREKKISNKKKRVTKMPHVLRDSDLGSTLYSTF